MGKWRGWRELGDMGKGKGLYEGGGCEGRGLGLTLTLGQSAPSRVLITEKETKEKYEKHRPWTGVR